MRVLDANGVLKGIVKERLIDQSKFNPESQVVRLYSNNIYSWQGFCYLFPLDTAGIIYAEKGWNALFMQFNDSNYQFDTMLETEKHNWFSYLRYHLN